MSTAACCGACLVVWLIVFCLKALGKVKTMMPPRQCNKAGSEEASKSCHDEVKVQIYLPGGSLLSTIQINISRNENVCMLADRLLDQLPHFKNDLANHIVQKSGTTAAHCIIIDFGNGRSTFHNIPCSTSYSDPVTIVKSRAYVRLFMMHGDFDYLLDPGENVTQILKLQEDNFNPHIKLRVEITQGEQEQPVFKGSAVLDAAGNTYFHSIINPFVDDPPLYREYEGPCLPIEERITVKRKRQAKKKVAKCKDLPKKNVSAYIHFLKSVWKDIKSKNPNHGSSEMGSLIGKLYRDLSHDDKLRWDEVAQADKKRYEHEMTKFYLETNGSLQQEMPENLPKKGVDLSASGLGEEEKKSSQTMQIQENEAKEKTSTNKKRKRQGNKQELMDKHEPKRNVTAYIHYAMHIRDEIKAKNPNLDFAGIGVELGKMYRDLSEEERRHWAQISLLDKERYLREKNDQNIQLNASKVLKIEKEN